MTITLSPFTPEQSLAVTDLFKAVFTASEGLEEGTTISELVSELILSTDPSALRGFVAVSEDTVVGGIFFSALGLPSAQRAFLLSPVAIATHVQQQGLGQRLIRHGLEALRADDVELVFTYGDPAFYGKVGFAPVSEQTVPPPQPLSQPEGWLGQSLRGDGIAPMTGPSQCVKAFDYPRYW